MKRLTILLLLAALTGCTLATVPPTKTPAPATSTARPTASATATPTSTRPASTVAATWTLFPTYTPSATDTKLPTITPSNTPPATFTPSRTPTPLPTPTADFIEMSYSDTITGAPWSTENAPPQVQCLITYYDWTWTAGHTSVKRRDMAGYFGCVASIEQMASVSLKGRTK